MAHIEKESWIFDLGFNVPTAISFQFILPFWLKNKTGIERTSLILTLNLYKGQMVTIKTPVCCSFNENLKQWSVSHTGGNTALTR